MNQSGRNVLKLVEKRTAVSLSNWGSIHCSGCDDAICYFPPDIRINIHDELPLYCKKCAENMSVEGIH